MTVYPRRRLALLALAKFAGIGALLGVALGVAMTLDGQGEGSLLLAPLALAALAASTFGSLVALSWWLLPGRVTYSVIDGHLTAARGRWTRTRVPVDRISSMDFDMETRWSHLVFTGWFGWDSPIPTLTVTTTATANRWDPSNRAVIALPRILLIGERQKQALHLLRTAVDQQCRQGTS